MIVLTTSTPRRAARSLKSAITLAAVVAEIRYGDLAADRPRGFAGLLNADVRPSVLVLVVVGADDQLHAREQLPDAFGGERQVARGHRRERRQASHFEDGRGRGEAFGKTGDRRVTLDGPEAREQAIDSRLAEETLLALRVDVLQAFQLLAVPQGMTRRPAHWRA